MKGLFLFLLILVVVGGGTAETQQPKKVSPIGYLNLGASSPAGPNLKAFQQGLRELGYVEGKNIRVEYRYANGKVERLSELLAELVNLRVEVIVATSTQAIDAARRATKTIPIVFPLTFDPVASGFVASLARPGGNLMGLTTLNQDVAGSPRRYLRGQNTQRREARRSPGRAADEI